MNKVIKCSWCIKALAHDYTQNNHEFFCNTKCSQSYLDYEDKHPHFEPEVKYDYDCYVSYGLIDNLEDIYGQ